MQVVQEGEPVSFSHFVGVNDLETQTLDLRDEVDELRPCQETREERSSKGHGRAV
jgi:hypothetical protein